MEPDGSSKRTTAILSVGILAFSEILFLFAHDIFYWTPYITNIEEGFDYYYWNSVGNISAVGLFALPMLIWHVSDLLTFSEPRTRLTSLLGSYPLALYTMLAGIVGYAVIASGLTERIQCWEAEKINSNPNTDFFMLCHPNIGFGIEFLVLPFLVLCLLLAFSKLAFAAFSTFRPAA